MAYLVLIAWLVQSAVGIALLLNWWRHGRRAAPRVIVHVALGVVALGLWIALLATGAALWGWIAFALITIGNGIGDSMLVRRWRSTIGPSAGFWGDYGRAIRDVFRGRMPRAVTFHALFAGVVYFSCLAACIMATAA